jgi:hypothetical protein
VSYNALLKHRCQILRLTEDSIMGMPTELWKPVAAGVRCFLDLGFIRQGKDPMWTPEAGRPADRSGVLFVRGDAVIKSGDRIVMTKGPTGTFQIEGAIDEAWQPTRRHHIEVGVVEVGSALAKGSQQ